MYIIPGTSGKHYQEMLEPNSRTLLGKQISSNNPHLPASTQRFSVKTYKHLALQVRDISILELVIINDRLRQDPSGH